MTENPPTTPSSSALEEPDAHLEAEIISLARHLSAGTYELLRLVGEYDARGTWALRGAISCAHWLAGVCDIEISTARTQVRVARAIRAHPGLDAAMAKGDVSYAKARVLVPSLTDQNAAALVGLAATTPAGKLGTRIAAWSLRHEDPELIAGRQHDARSTSWRTEADGMVVITHRLPPAEAAPVMAAIDAQVMRNCAPAGASLAQQRADAFVEVISEGGATVDTEVVIHVRGDEPCTLSDGTPIANHEVAKLIPDSFISLLVKDNERRPIDASPRRRSPSRRQRRVIDERDEHCQCPGCTATQLLQYDHIVPYAKGGLTVIDNLRLACGSQNRDREKNEWPGSA